MCDFSSVHYLCTNIWVRFIDFCQLPDQCDKFNKSSTWNQKINQIVDICFGCEPKIQMLSEKLDAGTLKKLALR